MVTTIEYSSAGDLLQEVAKLDPQEFEHFFNQVLALRAQRQSQTLSRREAELLKQINLGIAPTTWQRYDVLKAKRQAATLTDPEHTELIAIGNQIEEANARRIAALTELATMYGTSLKKVMDRFGIQAPGIE